MQTDPLARLNLESNLLRGRTLISTRNELVPLCKIGDTISAGEYGRTKPRRSNRWNQPIIRLPPTRPERFRFEPTRNTRIRQREIELENPAALIWAHQGSQSLGALILWYIDEFEQVSEWQRSKGQHLRLLGKQPIAQAEPAALTCQALVDHIRTRRHGGTGPATVANDLTWIGVVLRAAKSVRGLQLQPTVG